MANKFKVGDRVVVIGLDKGLIDEPYEGLGEEYPSILLKVGIIHKKHKNAFYSINFETEYYVEEWLFEEKHLILEKDFTQDIKDVITVLYGKNL